VDEVAEAGAAREFLLEQEGVESERVFVGGHSEGALIASELAETGTIDDLAALTGKPFSIGVRNSGTEGSGQTVLGNLGIDYESFELSLIHISEPTRPY